MTARETGAVELKPLDMVLFCPKCGLQHVDAPTPDWTNPPHRSHLCHECGCVWRPADVPTNGVALIQTCGVADTVFYNRAALTRPQPTPSATGEIVERLNALLRMTVPVPAGCVGEEGSPMSPEFRVSVQLVTDEGVHFIIHADGHSSDTLDIVVTDKGLALLAPFKSGEERVGRIARTATLIEQQAATIAELREAIGETLDKDFGFWSSSTQAERRARLYGAWKNSASAGTAETQSGSGRKPASPTAAPSGGDAPTPGERESGD